MFANLQLKGTFKPLQDWVILRPIREKKKGSLYLPDAVHEYGRCPVVAVGPLCSLKVGEVVYIQRFVDGEFKFELNGEMVYGIREKHLNVVIEKVRETKKTRSRARLI